MAQASESSAPFSTSSTATEEAWARLARTWGVRDGVWPSTSSFDPPDLKVTASGGTTVTVAAGEATVGGFYYRNSTAFTLAVPTNSSGSTQRTDAVILEANQTTNEVFARYVTGGASAPAVTQSVSSVWQMRLAEVRVAAGGSVATSGDTLDRRVFVGSPTITVPTGYVPPVTLGQLMSRPDGLYVGTTTGWAKLYPVDAPVWTRVDDAGTGSFSSFAGGYANRGGAYFDCAYTKVAHLVTFRGWFKATTSKPAGSTLFILPAGYLPSQQVSIPAINAGRIDIAPTGAVLVTDAMNTNDVAGLDGISFYTG
jgi:hypothetical protein